MSRYVIFLLTLCRYVPPSCLMQPKPPVLYVVAWFALSIVPGQAEIIEVHTISQGSEIGAFFLFMLKPFTLTGSASSRLHASTSCSIHIFFVCLLEVVSASSVCFTLFIISFFIAQISWGCLLSDHVESRFFMQGWLGTLMEFPRPQTPALPVIAACFNIEVGPPCLAAETLTFKKSLSWAVLICNIQVLQNITFYLSTYASLR